MDSAASDAATERSGEEPFPPSTSRSRTVEWVLIEGSRLGLALGVSTVVFVSLLVFAELGVIAFTNSDSMTRMASGMIAGAFSLVIVVVSINQLILSQEFSPAGEFRDRRAGVEAFYRDVEDATGVAAAPTAPTGLLELLATAIRERARRLAETAADHQDDASSRRVVDLADAVADRTARLEATLEGSERTTFDALSTAVEYDDASMLYEVRHQRGDVEVRSTALDDAFDDLVDVLRLFDTAREHLKTIYLQRELTRFSQLTVYFGIPAVFAAVLITLLYGDLGGATLAHVYLQYVISLLATLVVLPLLLLASFILRIATITRRTVPIGPVLARLQAGDSSEGSTDRPE